MYNKPVLELFIPSLKVEPEIAKSIPAWDAIGVSANVAPDKDNRPILSVWEIISLKVEPEIPKNKPECEGCVLSLNSRTYDAPIVIESIGDCIGSE